MKTRREREASERSVLGAFVASMRSSGGGAPSCDGDIIIETGCTSKVAARVATLRRYGTAPVLGLWREGHLTLRQLERIVLEDAFDVAAQIEAACQCSALARAVLARPQPELRIVGDASKDVPTGGPAGALVRDAPRRAK